MQNGNQAFEAALFQSQSKSDYVQLHDKPVVTDLHVFLRTLSLVHWIYDCETQDPWTHLFHYQQVQVWPIQCLCKQHTTIK